MYPRYYLLPWLDFYHASSCINGIQTLCTSTQQYKTIKLAATFVYEYAAA